MDQKEFFARVLPGGNHYIAYPGKLLPNGRTLWAHKSFVEPYEGVQQASVTHRWGKDVYFAVASFKDARRPDPQRDGRTRAYRKQENVEALKCLFLDVDFKAYDSPEHTISAVDDFLKKSKIQKPTIIVRTGGGLHIYWTFPVAIPLHEWQPLANGLAGLAENLGLRADLQCTIDSARILRVPETLNHKYDPPRLCEVQGTRPDDINMAEMASLLTGVVSIRVKGGRQRNKSAVAQPSMALDPEVAKMFADSSSSDLGEGVGVSHVEKFAREIAKGCGVIGDMLERGGDGDHRDLWNNMLLLMAYTRDGREYAHLMSKGDPRYSPEETEREFDMKVGDADKLGPTTCATFSRLSSKCQTCPHFNKIKSPITLGAEPDPEMKEALTKLIEPTFVSEGNTYTRCNSKDGTPITPMLLKGAELQRPTIITDSQGRYIMRVCIKGKHGTTKMDLICKSFNDRGYLVSEFNTHMYHVDVVLLGKAMGSWMDLLRQEHGGVLREGAFGWADAGFTLAGVRYDASGATKIVASVTDDLARNYGVKGSPEPWLNLTKHMLADPRIELQILLATAFAAPLLHMTEHNSTVVVIRSPQSGVGKTSVMQIARAVWGNPKDMSHANDTALAAEGRLATLTNMPWYWDELKLQDNRAVSNTIHQIIQGRSKERSSPTGDNRPTHITRGMLVIATNASISEMMKEANPNTDAGTYRVMEIELPARAGAYADVNFNHLLRQLDDNYGHAGVIYAKALAKLQSKMSDLMLLIAKEIQAEHPTTLPERFWMSSACAILLGAKIAKVAGLVDFDEAAMRKCLLGIVTNSREVSTNDSPEELARRIYSFFSTRMYITDRFDFTTKQGAARHVTTIEQPTPNMPTARVRLAVAQNELLISYDGIEEYAKYAQQQCRLVEDKIKRIARPVRTNLDKGISATRGAKISKEKIYVLSADSVLGAEEMQKWATSVGGHSAASPGSSSGTAPTSSTTP